MNFIAATLTASDDTSCSIDADDLGALTLPVAPVEGSHGDPVCLGIRPEDLSLATDGDAGGFIMKVKVLERLGGIAIAYGSIKSQASDSQSFKAVLPGDVQVAPGEEIHLHVEPSKCHLFSDQGIAMRRLKAEV